MANEMFKGLKALYRKHGAALPKELKNFTRRGKLSLPLLIDPRVGGYAHTNPRWLTVGQETNKWGHWKSGTPVNSWIEKSLGLYGWFDLCRNHPKRPFWRATYQIGEMSGNFDEPNFLWTNLIKFDMGGKRVPKELEEIAFDAFNVLAKEIEIIAPDAVIFFVGTRYETRLNQTFKEIEYKPVRGFSSELLSRCAHTNLPFHSYWTHHPRRLSYQKRWNVIEKLGQFVKEASG
jgi:hypothetical protein